MKNKIFLLSAAAFMFFAVFAGLLTKSNASDINSNTESQVLFLFDEAGGTQMKNESSGNSTSTDGIANNSADLKNTLVASAVLVQNSEENAVNASNVTQTANTQAVVSKTVNELVWFKNGDAVFQRGNTAIVTDVLTRKSFTIYRKGGTNHADVEPLTIEDTKTMKGIYGGTWSWDRRAIWVEIDGQLYAGSMNGMPHGKEIIADNNFNGHFCIHFTNSRTHATNRVDKSHQAAIRVALNTKP